MSDVSRIAGLIVRDVCELADRTSPDGAPDMLLVTQADLQTIVEDRLEEERELSKAWLESMRGGDAPDLYLVDRLGTFWIIGKRPELAS